MTRRFTSFDRALLAVAALLIAGGCSSLDNCPSSGDPLEIPADDSKTDLERLVFESAPWGGKLDAFPAKTELWFEHGLGVTPLVVKAYLSFSEVGTNDQGGGSVAESAGNQALIDCVDSRVIVVRNDTCERDFHIRVVAYEQAPHDNGEACGKL